MAGDQTITSHGGESAERSLYLNRNRSVRNVVSMIVMLLLVVAAVFIIVSQRESFLRAMENAKSASPVHVGMLLIACLLNIICSAVVLHQLTGRYGRIETFEMQALIAAAALLNYLPMRAGMISRMVYHKTVHQISILCSTKAMLYAMGMTVVAGVYLIGLSGVHKATDLDALFYVGLAVPCPALAIVALMTSYRAFAWAMLFRYVDAIMWAVRFYAAFAIIGHPISVPFSLVLAAIGMLISLVPVGGHGLGLREVTIGLVAPYLSNNAVDGGLSITADLVINRPAEMLMTAIVGIPAIMYISRRWPGFRNDGADPASTAAVVDAEVADSKQGVK